MKGWECCSSAVAAVWRMINRHRMVPVVCASLLAAMTTAKAQNLISNTGFARATPDPGLFSNGYPLKMMDWTLSQSETNVSISVLIGTTPGSTPGFLTAYLESALAPANNPPIAQITLNPTVAAEGAAQPTTLFTGLALPAGTYYLMLYDSGAGDYWQFAASQRSSAGVTTTGTYWTGVVLATPLWQSTFNQDTLFPGEVGFGFTVTGTQGTIYPPTCASSPYATSLYNLRQQVGANDVNVASGDQIQTGAYCVLSTASAGCGTVGADAGITGTATETTTVTLMQANDNINPNHLLQYVPVIGASPPAGPWTLTLTQSAASASCNTPTLADQNGVVAPAVAAPQNVVVSTPSGATTPTITWTEPPSFLSAATAASGGGGGRIQIWSRNVTPPVQIYAQGLTSIASSNNFAVPASWTTNGQTYSLTLGNAYTIEIQNLLFRSVPGSTGNPNVLSRSRTFFDYTPITLPNGVTTVAVPTVNPTGSSGGTSVYSYNSPVTSGVAIFVETPPPSSQSFTLTVAAGNPNFTAVQSPSGGAYDGASVYILGAGGAPTLVGTLQGGVALSLVSGANPNGVASFELVLPGGTPVAKAAKQRNGLSANAPSGPPVLGLSFGAAGNFSGTITPSAASTAAGPGATDGPLPPWALLALGAGLIVAARRRLRPAA
jgi:hypothetical protein